MGATFWSYVVPYTGDITTTLATLQHQVFEQEYASDYASLAELWDDEEFMNEAGTATVLDTPRIADATEPPSYGTLRPLTPERLQHHFGTDRPTLDQFQRAEPQLAREGTRWSGHYLLLWEGGAPTRVAFWGATGD
jgi:hypothetical protein